jgi:isoleucyl-tRNA synthetase
VQRLRKEAGLVVSDRIRLAVHGPAAIEAAARAHRGYIAGEVLATAFMVGDEAGPPGSAGRPQVSPAPAAPGAEDALASAITRTVDLDGSAVHVSLSKDTH